MAQVWRGVHRDEQLPVAVKFITADKAADATYVESFEREVQAVAALDHPGIVRVFDYGRLDDVDEEAHPQLRAGSPYLAMELFEAGTLRQNRSIASWTTLRAFLFELLDALAHAHARGLVHRDIKPENILCQQDGTQTRFILSDFGLAHAADDGTASGVAGTPHYMPPEQLRGTWRDFGPWTDLYALGCLAYELVSGKPPFDASEIMRIVQMQLQERLPPLQPQFSVPDKFEAFLRRMVAKDPAQRFRRAADAAFALAQLETPRANVTPGGLKTSAPEADPMVPGANATTLGDFDQPTQLLSDIETHTLRVEAQTIRHASTFPLWADARSTRPDSPAGDVGYDEDAPAHFAAPPPLPGTWELEHSAPHVGHLTGAGLELFGLRAIPFTGRTRERDAIWGSLRDVTESGQLHLVSLRGPAGIGKTCLAEWMSCRAHELGAATVLEALHSLRDGAHEGVPAMLERYFGVWHFTRRQIYERIRGRLDHVRPADADANASSTEGLAGALTEIIRPSTSDDDEGPTHLFSNHGERYAAVCELFEWLSAERPIIVLLDDAIRSPMVLGFVRYLMEHASHLPTLLLLTSSGPAAADNPMAAERLRQIEDEQRATRLDLDTLDSAVMGELVRRTLPLEPALIDRIERSAEGVPLYVIQLIGDWVSQGALIPGDEGFQLRADEPEAFPDNVADLWIRRIERLLMRFPAPRRWDLRVALELAASLGLQIDQAEWLAACEARGVEGARQILPAMIEENLARLASPGALFAHELLAERLVESSRRAGRARENHLACAKALEKVYPASEVGAVTRSVRHLMSAHAFEEVLDKLGNLIWSLKESGDFPVALSLIDLREEAADRLELGSDDHRRVRNWWLRGHVLLAMGDLEEARRYAAQAIEPAERFGWHREAGHAQLVEGRALLAGQTPDRALEAFGDASRHFAAIDDVEGMLRARFGQGVTWLQLGELSAARRCLEDARQRAKSIGDDHLHSQILGQLGFTHTAEGHVDRATACLEQAHVLAARIGSGIASAAAARYLGEAANYQQDWATARRWYEEAYESSVARLEFTRHYDRLHLAVIDVRTDEFERAYDTLCDVRSIFEQTQHEVPRRVTEMALVACAAGLGHEREFLEGVGDVLDGPDPAPSVAFEMAALAEKTAALADEHGWPNADDLRQLAARWSEGSAADS